MVWVVVLNAQESLARREVVQQLSEEHFRFVVVSILIASQLLVVPPAFFGAPLRIAMPRSPFARAARIAISASSLRIAMPRSAFLPHGVKDLHRMRPFYFSGIV
jgi:hypothetical protein